MHNVIHTPARTEWEFFYLILFSMSEASTTPIEDTDSVVSPEGSAAPQPEAASQVPIENIREVTLDHILNFRLASYFFGEVPQGLTARQIRVLGYGEVTRCGALYLTSYME